TEGGFGPFFSPDGKWIGFFRERRLFKVSLRGGAPVTLAGTVPGRVAGASWGPDGTIVFARGSRAALWAVPADGGSPEQIASPNLENGEYGYLWPEILPDADTVIFSLELVGMAAGDDFRFGFTSLKTREVRFDEANGGGQARYLESGHLTFVRAGTLFAAPFDPAMATLTGPAEPIVDDLLMLDSRTAQLAVARSGSFAFVPGGNPNRHLSWISRDGSSEMVALDPGGYGRHRLSPGSRAIALEISERCYVMGHGRIVFEGTPAELRANAYIRKEWLEV
ncbi:MAG: PD40 domain-containing protein, partial [Proteobacteria bacterium]|nr:PD40 domain-containing protein [Pseudomonadota bacterium]